MLTARRLPILAKRLIDACGGLDEASKACEDMARPYSIAQLSRCQTAGSGCFLPLDIIACLEAYSGQSIIGQALVEARPCAAEIDCLMTEASENTEAAASFQSKVRRAIADGAVTPAEQAELAREAETLFAQARDTVSAVEKLKVTQ